MRRVVIVVAGLLAASCSPHHTASNPRPPFELPEAYTVGDEAEATEEASPDRWWVAFGDPELTYLVDEALAHNFQLGAAWARYEQSRTGVQAAASAWFPQINAQLEAARRRQVVVFGALGRQEFEVDSYNVSLPVSYELDVWHRVGHNVAAGAIEMVAARDDVEALAMTLAANVVEAWLELLQQRATRALLEEQLETNELYAELVELRFSHGLGTALDVHQQQQQLSATEAQLAQALGSEQIARQQLAVLVGRPPSAFAGDIGSLPEPTVLPPPPPVPQAGIPGHLLLTRPDVRAARRRVEAQDHRVGAAIADLFPAFRFNASIGLSSPTLEGLVSSFVYSIAGSLLAAVLDGGRRDAEIRRNRAVLRERLQNFGHVLLTAMMEVEGALARERQLTGQREHLEAQLEAARSALTESRRRYSEGLSDYLPVLTSLAAAQRLEQTILAIDRQRLSQRVQLARALGGTWTAELEPPRLPLPEDGEEADDEDEPRTEDEQ